MESKFYASLEKPTDSNWAVEKFVSLFANTHAVKPARGSSCIPTPTRNAAPTCGLINIRNEDHACVRYCMVYDQSIQGEKTQRITALQKVEDNYDYTGIAYPTTFDDITTFEDNNKLTISVYGIENESTISMRSMGNIEHCRNGMVNLLLVEDGEQAHFIYIQELEHLLHICKTGHFFYDMKYCPHCSKGVKCVEESLEDHLMKKHFSSTSTCNLQLPEEGATMKFKTL